MAGKDMTKKERDLLQIGDWVFCSFGRAYRKARVIAVRDFTVDVDGGINSSGDRMLKTVKYDRLQTIPRQRWIQYVRKPNPQKREVFYKLTAQQWNGDPVHLQGRPYGSIYTCYEAIRDLRKKKSEIFGFVITEVLY